MGLGAYCKVSGYDVQHASFEEQQALLILSPAKQNLKIYLNGKETNGSVAEALRRIAKLEGGQVAHDDRLKKLEHWQIAAASIIGAAIILGPAFFWKLGQWIGG